MNLLGLKNVIKEELKTLKENKKLLLEKKTCRCDETHQINNVPDGTTCTVACGTIWPDIEFNPQDGLVIPGGDGDTGTTGGRGPKGTKAIDFKTGK